MESAPPTPSSTIPALLAETVYLTASNAPQKANALRVLQGSSCLKQEINAVVPSDISWMKMLKHADSALSTATAVIYRGNVKVVTGRMTIEILTMQLEGVSLYRATIRRIGLWRSNAWREHFLILLL